MDELVIKAAKYARYKHRYQLDDDGESYFKAHLEKVGIAIRNFTDDPIVIAAAYLHDVLEDTPTTVTELAQEFGLEITQLVHEVTQEGKKDNYGYYFPRLKSKEGILIKLIDRASNVSRMDKWSEARQQQFLRKTKFWRDGNENRKTDMADG
jgi:GTP pyrophosphokinase